MINEMIKIENNIGKNIYTKIDHLWSELVGKKVLKDCTDLDKKRIYTIINEIKYEANRIKNLKIQT